MLPPEAAGFAQVEAPTRRAVLLGLAGLLFSPIPSALADSGAIQALKGRQVTLLIGSDVGGNNDIFARLFGRHLKAVVPQIDLFIRNIGQAGGKLCAKTLQESPADGSIIALIPAGVMPAQFLGEDGVAYDIATWSWIGKLGSENRFLVKGRGADFDSILDLRADRPPASVSVRSTSSFSFYETLWINAMLGVRMKPVPGYKSGEKEQALISGEVMVTAANYPDDYALLESPGVAPILHVSAGTMPAAYDRVPSLADLLKGRDRYPALMRFLETNYELSRWIIAPPAMDPTLLEALRTAFDATVASPAFKNEARKLKLLTSPLPGRELAARMASILDDRDDLSRELRDALACGKSLADGVGDACHIG